MSVKFELYKLRNFYKTNNMKVFSLILRFTIGLATNLV